MIIEWRRKAKLLARVAISWALPVAAGGGHPPIIFPQDLCNLTVLEARSNSVADLAATNAVLDLALTNTVEDC